MGNCNSNSIGNPDFSSGPSGNVMSRNERKFIKECFECNKEFIEKHNARKRLDEFIDKLSLLNLEKGEKLFACGEKSDKLYILLHGQIGILSDEGVDYGTQEKGALIGTFGFYNNKPRSAHAKALKSSRLFYIVSLNSSYYYINQLYIVF